MEIRIIIDDRIAGALRRVASAVTRRRLTALVVLALLGSGLVALAAPAVKPNTFASGDAIVASEVNANFDAIFDALNARVIRADTTITVAAADGCQGLLDALAELQDVRIVADAEVTIELQAGTYVCTETVDVQHANGENLNIVGAGATRADVTLQFPADVTGIRVRGHRLGSIQKLTVAGGDGSAGDGVTAVQGGDVTLVDVEARDFANGIAALQGANLAGLSIAASSNTRHGIYAARGATVTAENAVASGNGIDGFNAAVASSMTLVGTVQATSNGASGLAAISGGQIEAADFSSIDNDIGVFASDNGLVTAMNVTITGSGDYGTYCANQSLVRYRGSVTAMDNTTADTNVTVNSMRMADGALIAQP